MKPSRFAFTQIDTDLFFAFIRVNLRKCEAGWLKIL